MPRPPDAPAPRLDASAAGWSAAPGDVTRATWHDPGDEAPIEASGGRYIVGPLLGEGGMGRVYAATDLRLDREVALKEALPGTEARLAREARVTARLDHPNIVPVHDAGRSPDGRVFYAMRLVRGRSLAAALADARGAARLRHVRTLLAVADAVAYAHARGVVHRDLKPANVLVGEFGETQVMDWGVARVLGGAVDAAPDPGGAPVVTPRVGEASDGDDLPGAALTRVGGVVGTPRYMAPEQARGEPVDARADVWSLGAVLYEILAGAPPYGGTAEEALAAARVGWVPPLRDRAPDAPAELVAIAERALHPDASGRYPTARAFAADLEAWLDGRRVQAHAYTPRELLGRLVRAWRVPLAVTAGAAALLAVGAAVATARVVAERDRAQEAETATAGALADAEDSLAHALVARARMAMDAGDQPAAELSAVRALTLRESAEARGVLAAFAIGERPRLVSRAPAPACDRLRVVGDVLWCDDAAGSGVWDPAANAWRWRVEGGTAYQAGEWAYVLDGEVAVPRVFDIATGRAHPERHAAISGLVIGSARGGAMVAELNGEVKRLLPGAGEAATAAVCADGGRAQVARAEGRWEVVACYDGSLLVWDGGAPRVLPSVMSSPTALAILGDTLVVGNAGGAMHVLDLRTGARTAGGDSGLGPVRAIERWPGGRGVAVLGDRGVGWWDTDTAAVHLRLARTDLRALATDDTHLWLVADALERWSAPRVPPARVLQSPAGVGGVAIDDAGERLLAYGGGGSVRLWSVADGRLLGDLRTQEGVTKAAAFGEAGVLAVSASPPGVVWHPAGAADGRAGHAPRAFVDARYKRAFVLRSGWAALLGYGREVSFVRWGADTPAATAPLDGEVYDAAVAPGGAWGVVLDARGGVHRVEGSPPTATRLFVDPKPGAIAVTAGRIVVASDDEVRVYDEAGTRLAAAPAAGLRDVAVSPDGRWVAAGSAGGRTYVWEADSGVLRAVLHGHDARVQAVAFAPDGRWLATGSWDGTTRRWGLGVLDAPPAALQATLEAAWGRTLEDG